MPQHGRSTTRQWKHVVTMRILKAALAQLHLQRLPLCLVSNMASYHVDRQPRGLPVTCRSTYGRKQHRWKLHQELLSLCLLLLPVVHLSTVACCCSWIYDWPTAMSYCYFHICSCFPLGMQNICMMFTILMQHLWQVFSKKCGDPITMFQLFLVCNTCSFLYCYRLRLWCL